MHTEDFGTQQLQDGDNIQSEVQSVSQKVSDWLFGCPFPLTTHIARHTFACTVALGQGISKEVPQIMMGHTSIKTNRNLCKAADAVCFAKHWR